MVWWYRHLRRASVPHIVLFHWRLRSCRGTRWSKDGLPRSFVAELGSGFACLCCRHRSCCHCLDRNRQLVLFVLHEAASSRPPQLCVCRCPGQKSTVLPVCCPAEKIENHPDSATLLRTSLHVVVQGNCVTVPPSLCIRSTPRINNFSTSVKAQSRILSHVLSRVGTRQLACMPSPGQNASDETKGASAGNAVSHCMHALRNRGRDQFRIQNKSLHPIAEHGLTPVLRYEWSSLVDSSFPHSTPERRCALSLHRTKLSRQPSSVLQLVLCTRREQHMRFN